MASGVRVDDGHIEGAKHAFMGHRVAGGQRARGPIWASTTARKLPCKETKARKSLAVMYTRFCLHYKHHSLLPNRQLVTNLNISRTQESNVQTCVILTNAVAQLLQIRLFAAIMNQAKNRLDYVTVSEYNYTLSLSGYEPTPHAVSLLHLVRTIRYPASD